MSTQDKTDGSSSPEPTSPAVRGHREGTPSLARPLAIVAVIAVIVVAFLVLIPGLGGNPETFDAGVEPGPGAQEDTNNVEGQGAEPEGTGGVLEPGMLPDVEPGIEEPVGPVNNGDVTTPTD